MNIHMRAHHTLQTLLAVYDQRDDIIDFSFDHELEDLEREFAELRLTLTQE